MSSEIGARLHSDLLNRSGNILDSGQNSVREKSSFFQKNSNTYSNIYFNGIWYIIPGERTAGKGRPSKCEAEPAESMERESRIPDSQKPRSPENREFSGTSWASEPIPVNHCDRTRGTCYGSELNFAFISDVLTTISENVLKECSRYLFKTSKSYCLWSYRVQVHKISVFQSSVRKKGGLTCFWSFWFFRGRFMKQWLKDFFVDLFFLCGERQPLCATR